MTMRYDDGPFTSTPGEKPWSQCLHRWKVSIVSVLLFLLLPLLTTYRQNYYLVMGETIMQDPTYNASTQCCTELSSRCRRSAPGFVDEPIAASKDPSEPENCTDESQSCVLKDDQVNNICNRILEERTNFEVHLDFCRWRTLNDTIILDFNELDIHTLHVNQSTCLQMSTITNCTDCVRQIMKLDKDLKVRAEEHSSKLERYDCNQNYSMWAGENCSKCTVGHHDVCMNVNQLCLLCCHKSSNEMSCTHHIQNQRELLLDQMDPSWFK